MLHLGALPSVLRSVAIPLLTNAININGTLNVLEAARLQRVKRVVFSLSSPCAIADFAETVVLIALPLNPLSPYAS